MHILVTDAIGLGRVCGLRVAARWVWNVVRHSSDVLRRGTFQSADQAMGCGPFRCSLRGACASLVGKCVVSGIREIWVRDVYLGAGFLRVPPEGTVVDLGANMGNFTLLALGHGSGVRVVAVEASRDEVERLSQSLEHNGWLHRATVVNAFVGGRTSTQKRMQAHEACHDVGTLSEADLVRAAGGNRIALLKCDIEGSEFALLGGDSELLAKTDQVAVEIHHDLGDRNAIIRTLTDLGFETLTTNEAPAASIVLGRRSPRAQLDER